MHPTFSSYPGISIRGWALLICLLTAASANRATAADDLDQRRRYDPPIAAASDEAERAIRTIRVPAGLKVELFAAEPLLANPVAFCIDQKGKFYVAETFRHGAGVTDTREHMNWLDDDLACRTVADRVNMYRKYLGKTFEDYKIAHERVRQVVDRDGDGKADHATVFADGFNDPAAGIGAGLLARKDNVWYACIPWLWKLRDQDGDGKAEDRRLLHEGYGVHVGFLGHDLHGLRFGPEGKLYFSIGDRGINVKTTEGRNLSVPDTGSVLRCNPDGTELEVFATGLRNPQELAFDQFGNLFTGDNNSDSGDKARWVYLMEGGDSGWRIGYQFIEAPTSRGPWNQEKLWDPAFAPKAAYLVPPIANLGDGPSGLCYDPGVSLLPDRFKNHFFLVDFRGASGQSGIRSFAVKPKGAGFELVDSHEFVWSTLATDVDFGPDGALYYSDWVEGWEKPNKGRIYRVVDPARRADPAVARVKRILFEGMESRSNEELSGLLAHADMRVRQEAQFELVDRASAARLAGNSGKETTEPAEVLARTAESSQSQLARIHAIWGLGQLARRKLNGGDHGQLQRLKMLLLDRDPEIRAQAARIVGEAREGTAAEPLIKLLEDESPRVRSFAAIALGKVGQADAIAPLLALLRTNADKDAYIRHAAVMGLVEIGDREALGRAAGDSSASVRRGVLVALRRLEDPGVSRFLDDADPDLVLEAARAINDVPINAALPRLAEVKVSAASSPALLRRVANACFRGGREADAKALAAMASRAELSASIRTEAIGMLGEWARPSGRDKVMGLWRPIAARPGDPAAQALRPTIGVLFTGGPESVRQAASRAAASLEMKEVGSALAQVVSEGNLNDETRAEALKALEHLRDPGRVALARAALREKGSKTRIAALRTLIESEPGTAGTGIDDMLANGTTAERQGAIEILGDHPGAALDGTLMAWLDRLIAGKVPTEIQLDLLEAAGRRSTPEFRTKLGTYEAGKSKDDHLAAYRETLSGGDLQRGLSVFLSKADAACLRCHKVKGRDGTVYGGEVGPELTGVGSRQNREYLLESIVTPDRKIAQGYETVVIATSAGKVITGVLRGESDKEVRLITAEGQSITVPKDEIEERKRGPSAMPADIATKLTKSEIRDLIEFMAGLKAK